ncbi:MAG TPA: polysaccharide biosynthesis protein [Gammaproteobacteria bacterium]|nr:polysaccharide biosynthesis protein [Gammaproteobacteria bacterium]
MVVQEWICSVKNYLLSLPRGVKRALMASFDAVAIPIALWLALMIRLGGDISPYVHHLYVIIPYLLPATLLVFVWLGLYRSILRFAGSEIVWSIVKGVALSTLTIAAVITFHRLHGFPRSVLLIYGMLMVFYMVGIRIVIRNFFTTGGNTRGGRKTAIFGAGEAGNELAHILSRNVEIDVVCFIDDNRSLAGGVMAGLPVYHTSEIEYLIKEEGIEQILLAIPNASRRRRKEIIDSLECYPVHVYTIPAVEDIIAGRASVADLREIDISDLLGRDPVAPDRELFRACVDDKVVMVTGAGGSIGSELCRQIIGLRPKVLVLYEASEYALYSIQQEMEHLAQEHGNGMVTEVKALLGNVQDRARLDAVLSRFGVQTIYHTAAYKHVPIVEYNITAGVLNNIFGTRTLAETAVAHGVEVFVSISTDKAVRPTNVMGATKRFAELILQGLAETTKATRFCMVRFGNVLDSSGSVVPVFRKQIRLGGPVTVTHPEVVRYFMTIEEAAQLVIQAGSLGTGGDVFVLDMGDPVRIDDLARKMIRLMGLSVKDDDNPDGDIAIEYTGLRPGEKLFEELLIGDHVEGTRHPMILRAMEAMIPWQRMQKHLDELLQACQESEYETIRSILLAVVNDYAPNGDIVDHMRSAVVTPLRKEPGALH